MSIVRIRRSMDRTRASEARNAGSIPAGCKTNEMSIASGATELLLSHQESKTAAMFDQ